MPYWHTKNVYSSCSFNASTRLLTNTRVISPIAFIAAIFFWQGAHLVCYKCTKTLVWACQFSQCNSIIGRCYDWGQCCLKNFQVSKADTKVITQFQSYHDLGNLQHRFFYAAWSAEALLACWWGCWRCLLSHYKQLKWLHHPHSIFLRHNKVKRYNTGLLTQEVS